MAKTHNQGFVGCLKVGQEFESRVREFFEKEFKWDCRDAEDNKVDFLADEWSTDVDSRSDSCFTYHVECKYDRYAAKSGNFFFETMSIGVPSGVLVQEWDLWVQGWGDSFVMLNRQELSDALIYFISSQNCRMLVDAGNTNKVTGFLIKIEDFINYIKEKGIEPYEFIEC